MLGPASIYATKLKSIPEDGNPPRKERSKKTQNTNTEEIDQTKKALWLPPHSHMSNSEIFKSMLTITGWL